MKRAARLKAVRDLSSSSSPSSSPSPPCGCSPAARGVNGRLVLVTRKMHLSGRLPLDEPCRLLA